MDEGFVRRGRTVRRIARQLSTRPAPRVAAAGQILWCARFSLYMSQVPSANSPSIVWTDPQRQSAFEAWLGQAAAEHDLLPASLRLASADASFRRYFRIDSAAGGSRVVMDAPPAQENCRPFVQVAALLRAAGVRTAVLYSANDHLVEKAVSRELCAALAAGDVSVSSDAGHWANKLQAEEVAAMVARVIAA